MENKKYKAVELFAGIGGFRIACDNLGIETVWANDMDTNAVTVYRDNFGEDSIVQGDINTLIETIPDHDILTGGFPCQPFSKAGKKKGIEDYRGTLFETIVNVVNLKKPDFFVLENVNSLLFMQNGQHYKTILTALSGLGYKIEWRVFNAMEFGLPQNRNRVVIVGSKNGKPDESYLFNPEMDKHEGIEWNDISDKHSAFSGWGMAYGEKFVECDLHEYPVNGISLNDILEENVDESFYFTKDIEERISNSVYVNKLYKGVQILYNQKGGARMGYTIYGTDGVSPTLTASTSRHYERYKVGDRFRRLTNVEYARLQGFPDDHCKSIKKYDQYKLYGNAVPHQIVEYVISRIIKNEFVIIS